MAFEHTVRRNSDGDHGHVSMAGAESSTSVKLEAFRELVAPHQGLQVLREHEKPFPSARDRTPISSLDHVTLLLCVRVDCGTCCCPTAAENRKKVVYERGFGAGAIQIRNVSLVVGVLIEPLASGSHLLNTKGAFGISKGHEGIEICPGFERIPYSRGQSVFQPLGAVFAQHAKKHGQC